MAAPVITSVRNTVPADGKKFIVTLATPPQGTLSFIARRTPAGVDIGPLASTGGPTVYTVTVRSAALQRRMLYYIQASDDDGDSDWGVDWLCTISNAGQGAQVQDWLYAALRDNRAGLARAMEIEVGTTWPDGSAVQVARFVRGLPSDGGGPKFPVVGVVPSDQEIDWYAMEMGEERVYQFTLYAYAQHQVNVPWLQAIYALGEGIIDLLNQREYLEPALPCGLELRDCRVRAMPIEVTPDPDGGTIIGVRISWSGVLESAYANP